MCKIGRVGWQVQANIQFRDGNVNSQISEGFHVGDLVALARRLADDKMRLKPNTVDTDTRLLEVFDDIVLCGEGLGTCVLDVVIVVIEFCPGVCCCSSLESDLDILLTKNIVESVVSECTVVI